MLQTFLELWDALGLESMHIMDTWVMEEIMLLLQMEQGPGGNDRPQALLVAGRSFLSRSFNPFFTL